MEKAYENYTQCYKITKLGILSEEWNWWNEEKYLTLKIKNFRG
ncbi:MAG: hypothetical protein PWQ43_630 [Rikenellaceae bacterium]|nr:hypothetical protein [Rikenellaceae bacterium]MDN5355688.1 hypothetical protein [Rikenellaceae bacterium]